MVNSPNNYAPIFGYGWLIHCIQCAGLGPNADLEKVQEVATMCVPGIRPFSYIERFERLKFSLRRRRLCGSFLKILKIFRGFASVNPTKFLSLRGTTYTLVFYIINHRASLYNSPWRNRMFNDSGQHESLCYRTWKAIPFRPVFTCMGEVKLSNFHN